MAAVSCIYATPIQAQKLGNTIYRTDTLTTTQAKNLRDAYREGASQQKTFISIAVGAVGLKIAGFWTGMGFNITSNIAMSKVEVYFDQLANAYDSVATSGSYDNKVKCKYEYRRKGSND